MSTCHETANALAPLLGEGWSVDGDLDWTHSARLLGPDEATIYLQTENYSNKGKFHVTVGFPDGTRDVTRYDESTLHEINVSQSRGVETLAKEIQRRLLPAYLEQLADVRERLAKKRAQDVSRADVVAELSVAFKGGNSNYRPDEVRFGHGNRDYYGSVEVRHNGMAVDLEIRGLPTDLAHKIAGLLAEHDAEGEE